MMNDFMIRWTGVPSYWPEAHKARKLSAVFGTASQNISSLISPRVVCNYWLVRFIFSKVFEHVVHTVTDMVAKERKKHTISWSTTPERVFSGSEFLYLRYGTLVNL